MMLSRKFLLWQAAAAVAVVASMLVLPGAPVASTAIAMIIIWVLAGGAYRLSPYRSTTGAYMLLGIWCGLCILTTAQIWWCTTHLGGTCADPVLHNFDSHKYMWMADHVLQGDYERLYFMTAGLFYADVAWIFGLSIVPFTLVSTASILFAIVLAGYIGGSVGKKSQARQYSTATMAMCACVAFLIAVGALILKDAMVILGTAMAVAAVVMGRRAKGGRGLAGAAALFAGGCLLLMMLRTQWLVFGALGALIFIRADRRSILFAAGCIAFAATCYLIFRNIDIIAGDYDPLTRSLTVADDGKWYLTENDPVHSPYYAFAKRYFFTYPLWLKVLLLPLTCAVQYFIPLFWTAPSDIPMGPAMVYAHMGFGWYAVGGLILFYLIFGLRRASGMMKRLIALGVIIWITPAFVSAGLVSRYFLPGVPLLAPAAAAAWLEWRHDKRFKIFAPIYLAAVVAALTTAFVITG